MRPWNNPKRTAHQPKCKKNPPGDKDSNSNLLMNKFDRTKFHSSHNRHRVLSNVYYSIKVLIENLIMILIS